MSDIRPVDLFQKKTRPNDTHSQNPDSIRWQITQLEATRAQKLANVAELESRIELANNLLADIKDRHQLELLRSIDLEQLVPEHSSPSCSDDFLCNATQAKFGRPTKVGCCTRCYILSALETGKVLPGVKFRVYAEGPDGT